ncbi:MAG: sulfatase-like hydrolase/transferase, partial [Oscillospiraceae bacterium]|nr:sulfatase-like hydrolase/transferase [Oscillospiraceae bacterium]
MLSVKENTSTRRLWLPTVLSLLVFISFLAAFSARWYRNVYGDLGFQSILFTLTSDLSGVDPELLGSFLRCAFLPAVICSAAVNAFLFLRPPKTLWLKKLPLYPFPLLFSALCAGAGSLFLLYYSAETTGLFYYASNHVARSQIFEQQYADPAETAVTFPENKRNLIYLYIESMECSYLSRELGGAMERNLIPELYALAESNTNFSHNDGVGGFLEATEASWTIGAMTAQTAGIPLKTPDFSQNNYGSQGELFLPGATTLIDLLREHGYVQALMVGSDADFGGRRAYYSQHGVEWIYDLYTAPKDDILSAEQSKWGLADCQLYTYARQELTKLAQQDQPFAFTLLTSDTHHVGGYQCGYCKAEDGEPYEQSISCASRQAAEWIRWLETQPFYENTTVVISGDHLSMDNAYFLSTVPLTYPRRVYHCILNAPLEA